MQSTPTNSQQCGCISYSYGIYFIWHDNMCYYLWKINSAYPNSCNLRSKPLHLKNNATRGNSFYLALCGVATRCTSSQMKQICKWYMASVWMSKIPTSPCDSLTVTWCCVLPQMWLTYKLKHRTLASRRSRHKNILADTGSASRFFLDCEVFTKVTKVTLKCSLIIRHAEGFLQPNWSA